MSELWKPVLTLLFVFQVLIVPVHPQSVEKNTSAARNSIATRGEVIIRFRIADTPDISRLTRIVSIDQIKNDTITAYANSGQFEEFIRLNIPFEIVEAPSLRTKVNQRSATRVSYPRYDEYISKMHQFAIDFPQLCRLVDFGTTPKGHKLLALEISDNPGEREKEPVLFYSGSMHGDEPLGYILMLQLVDSLLSGYSVVPEITRLVDNAEVWINPLANPDGAYFLSDSSIDGAIRFNSNAVDLNRDFPEIGLGFIDTTALQPETRSMMRFMSMIKPVLSANFHGGAEVVNYPWDTWESRHADESWYKLISRAYTDTVHAHAPLGYMTFLNNGITRGISWYQVYGGRQDYVNYYLNGREVTIELGDDKIPPENDLVKYWDYNKRSLLGYMEEMYTGFAGTVVDSLTGLPLRARVRIIEHDFDNSFVYTRNDDGSYYRLIQEGTYQVVYTATGYSPKIVNVSVENRHLTISDIKLGKGFGMTVYPNPFTSHFCLDIPYSGYNLDILFIDMLGRAVKIITIPVKYSGQVDIPVEHLAPGKYVIHVMYNGQSWNFPVLKLNP
ncbi:MAG TPA: M14 family zinc carboxypeptidase [Bacteroidales bacterium]|nr:M14 family zinc carboxypeptidase [Bacteroidales bacterium]